MYLAPSRRDLVHRQTSMAAIQHIALGVYGFGCEDALTHLLNYVWPNIFESSPHVVQAFMGSIEGMRVGLGTAKVLQYTLQVRGCEGVGRVGGREGGAGHGQGAAVHAAGRRA